MTTGRIHRERVIAVTCGDVDEARRRWQRWERVATTCERNGEITHATEAHLAANAWAVAYDELSAELRRAA
jgi:hypothetical protein